MNYVILRTSPAIELTEDQFFALCQLNRDLHLERNAEGDIIIMPPTGFATDDRNSEINYQLRRWAKADGRGVATGSSAGFHLPNGADRAPDAAWTLRARLATVTREKKEKFLPLCPDFVIELRSPSDDLDEIKAKMKEYIENGARLGWLLDPKSRRVYVYRPDADAVVIEDPEEMSGDLELSSFVLDLREIWEPKI